MEGEASSLNQEDPASLLGSYEFTISSWIFSTTNFDETECNIKYLSVVG